MSTVAESTVPPVVPISIVTDGPSSVAGSVHPADMVATMAAAPTQEKRRRPIFIIPPPRAGL